jgi:hypothetical protein
VVAFYSEATNLDPGDADDLDDVFVKDLRTGRLTLVSTSASGVKGNGDSLYPRLSGDASRVTFYSLATNLDVADPDSLPDVYVKRIGRPRA